MDSIWSLIYHIFKNANFYQTPPEKTLCTVSRIWNRKFLIRVVSQLPCKLIYFVLRPFSTPLSYFYPPPGPGFYPFWGLMNQLLFGFIYSLMSLITFNCSSLHGWKYIAEDGRSWIERVLWFILCLCGFVLTIYFIVPIWVKWNSQVCFSKINSQFYQLINIQDIHMGLFINRQGGGGIRQIVNTCQRGGVKGW